jgi:hypothetical protein
MTPATDLVEPVTGSEHAKTPKTTDLAPTKTPAPDSLQPMTPASDLVEPVTGSEITKTPAPDLLPTKTPATDLVPTKPACNLVTTKTASDLFEPVDSIPSKMSTANYFYKASSRKLKVM